MAITVSALERTNPPALDFAHNDLAAASQTFADADTSFTGQVQAPVDSGVVWVGNGQPEASSVLDTNVNAMRIASLELEAAKNVVAGLGTALQKARNELGAAKADAPPGVTVHDDGTVSPAPFSAPPPGVDPYEHEKKVNAAKELGSRVYGALLHAAAADQTAAPLLSDIGSRVPVSVDYASPGSQQENAESLEQAVVDANTGEQFLQAWESIPVRPFTEEEYLDVAYGVETVHPDVWTYLDLISSIASFVPALRGLRLVFEGVSIAGRKIAGSEESGGSTPPPEGSTAPTTPRQPANPDEVPPGALSSAPQKAYDVARYVEEHGGDPPPGYVSGSPYREGTGGYRNNPRTHDDDGPFLDEKLPATEPDGTPITYKEYDVNPYTGENRGGERIVIGSDGRVYYTKDHYRTFDQLDQTSQGGLGY